MLLCAAALQHNPTVAAVSRDCGRLLLSAAAQRDHARSVKTENLQARRGSVNFSCFQRPI